MPPEMPPKRSELTDIAVRHAKPRGSAYKMGAGHGLYVEITPTGSKLWRFKFRVDGKEKRLSLGQYPDVPLSRAREKRDELRRQLADGIDPAVQRKAAKAARVEAAANSFEAVAREWLAMQEKKWAPSHTVVVVRRMERDLFPYLGARPIGAITAPELLQVLRRIEERGAVETAHRALQKAGQVFRYAVATGRAERDPSGDLRGTLTPKQPEHLAALTDPAKVGALLRTIWGYEGSPVVRAALRLHPYVFVRPGELRKAEWAEFDLDAAEWRIPGQRMKTKQPHIVPLSRQAVEVLREIEPLTGRGRYVFPGARSTARPMSDMAANAAMRRLGIGKEEFTGHGWRATARTLLDEQLSFRVDYIEHQLAHTVRDPLGRAYNRTKHLKERRAMMQAWADYLDGLKAGGNVIPLHGRRA